MLEYAEALGPPSLLYNTHTLFNVSKASITKLTSRLFELYKVCTNNCAVLKEEGGKHVSIDQAFFDVSKLEVSHRNITARLKMWPRVLAKGPTNLLCLC